MPRKTSSGHAIDNLAQLRKIVPADDDNINDRIAPNIDKVGNRGSHIILLFYNLSRGFDHTGDVYRRHRVEFIDGFSDFCWAVTRENAGDPMFNEIADPRG